MVQQTSRQLPHNVIKMQTFSIWLENGLKRSTIKSLQLYEQGRQADRPGRLEELDPDLIEEEESEDQS